ncbi:DUF2164 domain-containing protein [Hyphomonas sp. WL0036]|uniref:DUF2164 domain-containing protein n=1 Tax=Hyphomonas sediminis TaxID=2866160 RepID=UPI001C7E9408|nr:DUF2164 domain-containing protein [Hyphomonas sediminis]MBY9066147.1 DUF2164 domain-containing protein [Hyphomonas sediminis]
MKTLALSEDRRQRLIDQLRLMFSQEFDIALSPFQAGEVVDRMTALLGPAVYNEAVQDVRQHFQRRLDDLDGEVFVDDPG